MNSLSVYQAPRGYKCTIGDKKNRNLGGGKGVFDQLHVKCERCKLHVPQLNAKQTWHTAENQFKLKIRK